jgi:hypothetical protein
MKKFILILASILCLIGCHEPHVSNPTQDERQVYIQVGSKVLKVNVVTINKVGDYIYILTPKDTTVKVSIEDIGFSAGKARTSVIKVE